MSSEPSAQGGLRPESLHHWISGLAALVAFLAAVVTSVGIATAFGHVHRTFLSLRGETVVIQGGGLYANESASMAAQGVGMDLVTLLMAVPILLIATHFAGKGSVRGHLMLVGAFFYFAYSYLVILFGVSYNVFFLPYAALLSASIAGLVLSLVSLAERPLDHYVSTHFARRTIGWALLAVSVMFLVLWLSRIVSALISGKPPIGLESYTTLSVQAADLSIVIPLSITTSVLLLKHRSLGYVLAAPVLLFQATMGLGLVGMVIAMALMGTAVGVADAIPAVLTAAIGGVMAIHYFASTRATPSTPASSAPASAGRLEMS